MVRQYLATVHLHRRVTASVRKDFRPSMGRKLGLHRHLLLATISMGESAPIERGLLPR